MRLLVFFLISLSIGCTTLEPLNFKENKTNNAYLLPNHTLYLTNNDTCVVYTELNSKQLLYTRKNSTSSFLANLKIECILFTEDGYKDTTTYTFSKPQTDGEAVILSHINIALPELNTDYSLKITTFDENKNAKHYAYTTFSNDDLSPRHFLISQKSSGLPLYRRTSKVNDLLLLKTKNTTSVSLEYLTPPNFLAASPITSSPSVESNFKRDSSLQLFSDSSTFLFKTPRKESTIKITNDATQAQTYLFSFKPSFPKVTNINDMCLALRYITTNKEFKRIDTASNKRLKFEEFWLECGRTKEQAKVLIFEYYKRLEEANMLFSTYKAGWKTDRGMIFTVFGTPSHISENSNTETWLYGDPTNPASLSFTFDQQKSAYSTNVYTLRRSPVYQTAWYNAIERWRGGRIYLK